MGKRWFFIVVAILLAGWAFMRSIPVMYEPPSTVPPTDAEVQTALRDLQTVVQKHGMVEISDGRGGINRYTSIITGLSGSNLYFETLKVPVLSDGTLAPEQSIERVTVPLAALDPFQLYSLTQGKPPNVRLMMGLLRDQRGSIAIESVTEPVGGGEIGVSEKLIAVGLRLDSNKACNDARDAIRILIATYQPERANAAMKR